MRRALYGLAVAVNIAGAVALALGFAGLLWWTGEGFCVGTMTQCFHP